MQFIYLDGDLERQELIDRVHAARDAVISIANQVPEDEHFRPRYGDDSLAVMLANLQLFDRAALWFVKAASNGYAIRPPGHLLNSTQALLSRLFQRRIVSVTVAGIRKTEADVCEFIRTVPIDKLSADVLHPGRSAPYTVEQAMQAYFVWHWQTQLTIMQAVDGVADEN